MKNYFIRIFVITLFAHLILFGCDTSEKNEEGNAGKISKSPVENSPKNEKEIISAYEMATYTEKESGCDKNCARVVVNYPVFKNPNEELNAIIDIQIRQKVSEFVLEGKPSQTLKELSEIFISGFESFKNAFPEALTPWYIDMEIIVGYAHPTFVSISQQTTSYTGGAHTNVTSVFLNIDEDGKQIKDINFFINDIKKLKEIAEVIFRKQNAINKNQSLSDAGFTFENDQFSLTDNFGFTNAGIVFYYNSYEIASYAEGPSIIAIPFSTIQEIYRFDQIQS